MVMPEFGREQGEQRNRQQDANERRHPNQAELPAIQMWRPGGGGAAAENAERQGDKAAKTHPAHLGSSPH